MSEKQYFVTAKTRVGQILFCILFAAVGVWIFRTNSQMIEKIVGVAVIASSIACVVNVLLQSRQGTPRVVLNDVGLYDRQLGTPIIPWKDILAAKTVLFYGSTFVMLLLQDERERIRLTFFLRRFGRFSNRIFGLSPFTMNPNGLDVSATQIMADIQEKLIEHGLLSEG